jgi:hypothetical protein
MKKLGSDVNYLAKLCDASAQGLERSSGASDQIQKWKRDAEAWREIANDLRCVCKKLRKLK